MSLVSMAGSVCRELVITLLNPFNIFLKTTHQHTGSFST